MAVPTLLVAPTISVIPRHTMGPNPPDNPTPGDFWFDTARGFLFVWYNDGNTIQWVVANPGKGREIGPIGPQGKPGPAGPMGPAGPAGSEGEVTSAGEGRGVAIVGGGGTYITPPLVTKEAYMIRDIMQTYNRMTAVYDIPIGSATITGATWTLGYVTFTTAAPHLFKPGDTITVAGATPAGYNTPLGAAAVGGTTGSTIIVPIRLNPGVYVSGGVAVGTKRDGPFTPILVGSGLVEAELFAHGRQIGNTVSFRGVRSHGNGVAVDDDTIYTITAVTPDTFTFDTGGNALDLVPFGGTGLPPPANQELPLNVFFETMCIRLQNAPVIVPTILDVHCDCGIHGLTQRAHPADDIWDVVPGINRYTYELVGSKWVPDSVFLEGHCYPPGKPFDASVEINKMLKWCRDTGAPTFVQLPPGMMYVQKEAIRIPEGCTFQGYGMRVTALFWADYEHSQHEPLQISHVIECGGGSDTSFRDVIGTTIQYLAVYGCRTRARWQAGFHALALGGAEANPSIEIGFVQTKFSLYRIGIFGSSGYGVAMQGNGAKQDVEFSEVRIAGSDNDGYDYKDRRDINDNIQFHKCDTYHWALSDIGTNLRPANTLPNDPIKTTVGSFDFEIPRQPDTVTLQPSGKIGYPGLLTNARGQVATLTGTGTVNGIPLNGSFRCYEISPTSMILRSPVAATASGTGGGANMTVTMPVWSNGDVAYDCRARGTRLDHCYAEGWMIGRSGFRQRGGKGHSNTISEIKTSTGGGSWVAEGCSVRDVSPSWMLDIPVQNAAVGYQVLGNEGAVINCSMYGMGRGTGINVRSTTVGAQIVAPRIMNVFSGINIGGENMQLLGGVFENCSNQGVLVHGGDIGGVDRLELDPFVATAIGSDVVQVTDVAHGMITGTKVAFFGYFDSPTNGLVIERALTDAGNYTIVVLDADHYTIVLARSIVGAALDLEAWGGDNVDVRRPTDTTHRARDVHISDVVVRNIDPDNTSVGFNIGANPELADRGQADDITIVDCHDRGSSIPFLAYGTNLQFGPGNTGGVPNYPRAGANEAAPCWELVEERIIKPGATVDFFDFQNLNYPNIRLEILSQTKSGANNTGLYLSSDNCITLRAENGDSGVGGNAAGTSFIVLLSSIGIGVAQLVQCEMTHFNSTRRSTFTIDGGSVNAAVGSTFVAYQTGPKTTMVFVGGTAGVGNTLDTITIGGRNLLAVPVVMAATIEQMVIDVAAAINANTAASRFTAQVGTAATNLTIREAPTLPENLFGFSSNLPVAFTVTGDVRLLAKDAMGTSAFNSFHIDTDVGGFTAGTFRVYQKGG